MLRLRPQSILVRSESLQAGSQLGFGLLLGVALAGIRIQGTQLDGRSRRDANAAGEGAFRATVLYDHLLVARKRGLRVKRHGSGAGACSTI